MQALLLTLFLAFSPDGTPPQAAAQEPSRSKRVVYKEPQFPAIAREVFPPLHGIIASDGAERGRTPGRYQGSSWEAPLDAAAIDPARLWRYEPTWSMELPHALWLKRSWTCSPTKTPAPDTG